MAASKKPKQRGTRRGGASRLAFRANHKKPATRRKATRARIVHVPEHGRVLGHLSIPSGTLAILDIALLGYLPREALEPAIITCAVPRDRPLRVVGAPVGKGRFADCWDHVAIVIGGGSAPIVASRKLGEAGVDFARIACIDHRALDAWVHEDSLDGRADCVFWGRDDRLLAHAMNAPRTRDGYGWVDLPLAEAEAKADEVARRKAANRWLLASDLRPHSHHYYALAAARQSPDRAGMLDLAGTRMMLLFTSWGDGVFPIYADLDPDDRLVQVRIQLATPESSTALTAVNP